MQGAASTIFNDWYVVARNRTPDRPFPEADTRPSYQGQYAVMCTKDAGRMANCVDPDQTTTVCPNT